MLALEDTRGLSGASLIGWPSGPLSIEYDETFFLCYSVKDGCSILPALSLSLECAFEYQKESVAAAAAAASPAAVAAAAAGSGHLTSVRLLEARGP